jgi:glycosyltransferase involved in cell wall biosynthesis
MKRVLNIVNIFDIGILTTNTRDGEGISNSIMEYMALKKPVIVTDVGVIKNLWKISTLVFWLILKVHHRLQKKFYY